MNEICFMQILVISATQMEIAPYLSSPEPVDHLITGVGTPACIYRLQKQLQHKNYDCVIQAGIGGTFDANLALGETVLVKEDCFADLGIFEKGRLIPLFETGFVDRNETPYQDGWLKNESSLVSRFSLPKKRGVTVNMVSEDSMLIEQYRTIYKAEVESMEGAALHYVCLLEKIPFMQLRSISNLVGERDKTKWTIAAAVRNLNNHLVEITRALKLPA